MLTGPSLFEKRNFTREQETVINEALTIEIFDRGFYNYDVSTGRVVVPANNTNHRPLGFALRSYSIGDVDTCFKFSSQWKLTLNAPISELTGIGTIVYADSDNVFTTTAGNRAAVGPVRQIVDASAGIVWVEATVEP